MSKDRLLGEYQIRMPRRHGKSETLAAFIEAFYPSSHPVMGKRADMLVCDDVATPYGDSCMHDAVFYKKLLTEQLKTQWFTEAQWFKQKYPSNPKEDDMMDTPTPPSQRHYCHLCFAKREKLTKTDNLDNDRHETVEIVIFNCGTVVQRHLIEEEKDGDWTVTSEDHTVLKGAKCI